MEFYTALKNRRTIYNLSKKSTISDEKILEIIDDAVLHTPSPFNSQSARVVLLLNKHSDKFWSIVKETLRKIVPAEAFQSTNDKIDSFAAGYGTILYFEDQEVVEGLQAQFPLYKDNFPLWSLESAGMLQLVIWIGLEAEGLGASLQHYNPLVDVEVQKAFNIPPKWRLMAEMPFGTKTAEAPPKEFSPLDKRVVVMK